MLCDLCHVHNATVHVTEIVNGKTNELHICQACAAAKQQAIKEQFNIGDFLSGLMDSPESSASENAALKCGQCGVTFEQFRKKGIFGCSQCYETFKPRLTALLKRIHGAARHTGKVPAQEHQASRQTALARARKKLELAVTREDYEEAAVLRDEIHTLENNKKKPDAV